MPGRIPMTARQRAELLALPDDEATAVRHYGLDAEDLAAIAVARTPATRLGYALQLCALRYPGRHLRRGELLPATMLDHIAEQVGVDADVITDFARRTPTRYDQLAAIKARFGFRDLGRPLRANLMEWLTVEALPIVDGRVLLDRLLDEMLSRRTDRREGARSSQPPVLAAGTGAARRLRIARRDPGKGQDDPLDRRAGLVRRSTARHRPRLAQFAREGVRYTAQAFQQMGPARRHAVLVAMLREMEVTLTDAAIAMFGALVGRAHLRARKRLEQRVAASGLEGRERLMRVANILEAVTRAARSSADIVLAVQAVAPLDTLDADAAIIRRSASSHKDDALEEIAAEHRTFTLDIRQTRDAVTLKASMQR